MHANVVCLDFDDTINDYPGWENEGYAIIRGKPMKGVKEAIKSLRDAGWLVLVHSTRCGYSGGMVGIVEYLNQYNIHVDGVCSSKPPSDVYLDDKAIRFKGDWKKAVRDIKKAVHWKADEKREKIRKDNLKPNI